MKKDNLYTVQYFVFDETGNEILLAGGDICDSKEKAQKKVDTYVSDFKDYRYSVYVGNELAAERR